jgi:hypothetical protein
MSFSAYHEWFASGGSEELVYLSAPGRRDLPEQDQKIADRAYRQIREYEDYDTSDMLEWDVLKLHEAEPVTAIVALSEWDQIRAGRLRQYLDLEGTSEDVALHYRDKFLMKQRLQDRSVPTADFAAVSNALDLLQFARRAGYPLLIKPRLLAASVGIEILHSDEDVFAFARRGFGTSVEAQRFLIAERFVDFETEYHVDGIVVDGALRFVWPSRYVGQTSGFGSADLFGAVMLSARNPRRAELCDLIDATIKALPSLQNSTFHAEVFQTRDGALLVNEIAARTGGFRINDLIKAGFGLWLNREWARLQAGLPPEIAPDLTRERLPDRLSGYALFRPVTGRVAHIPQTCPFDFVFDYRTDAKVGARFGSGESSTHQMGSVVVTGSTETEVEDRLHQVHAWFYETLQMEDV